MGILDLFRRSAPAVEKRSAGTGYTAEVMRMRESFIAGRTGLGDLTGTVSSCVSLWQNSLSLATVTGTDLLGPCELALIGRSLAVRGEFVALIDGDQLVPASDWDVRTRNSKPVAYRLSVPEAGGGRTLTALAGEVVHVRINADPAAPWLGVSPLRTASLSAGMLHSVETALSEAFADMPFASMVVPMPEAQETDNTKLQRSFKGRRGQVLLRESVVVSAAGGPAPQVDWRPSDLTPSLEKAVPIETLTAARESIALAYGVLPAMLSGATTGPLIREAQRNLIQYYLQPVANLVAAECSETWAARSRWTCSPARKRSIPARPRAVSRCLSLAWHWPRKTASTPRAHWPCWIGRRRSDVPRVVPALGVREQESATTQRNERLFCAVIIQAFEDAAATVPEPKPGAAKARIWELAAKRRVRDEARVWLIEGSKDFNEVCLLAGMNPAAVMEHARKQGWANDGICARHFEMGPESSRESGSGVSGPGAGNGQAHHTADAG